MERRRPVDSDRRVARAAVDGPWIKTGSARGQAVDDGPWIKTGSARSLQSQRRRLVETGSARRLTTAAHGLRRIKKKKASVSQSRGQASGSKGGPGGATLASEGPPLLQVPHILKQGWPPPIAVDTQRASPLHTLE